MANLSASISPQPWQARCPEAIGSNSGIFLAVIFWFFRKKVEIDYPVSGVKKYTSDLSQLW
jgi:hypothetical protein